MQKKKIISLDVSVGARSAFLGEIRNMAQSNKSGYVCVANVHMIIEAHQNVTLAKVVNEADVVTPDGMPLVHYLNVLYGVKQERIAGMDLLPDLLRMAGTYKLSVFFYGSTDETLDKIAKIARNQFGVDVAGCLSPPFRKMTDKELQKDYDVIIKSKAKIVLVSLGCPKQELWMGKAKHQVNALMVGVGGAFPVFSGETRRAPAWMQRYSLEWLFRLIQEPIRLWKRYLITNSMFLYISSKNALLKYIRNK